MPGAPFLLSSMLLIVAFVLAWNVTRSLSRRYAKAAPAPAIVPQAMPIGEMPPATAAQRGTLTRDHEPYFTEQP